MLVESYESTNPRNCGDEPGKGLKERWIMLVGRSGFMRSLCSIALRCAEAYPMLMPSQYPIQIEWDDIHIHLFSCREMLE